MREKDDDGVRILDCSLHLCCDEGTGFWIMLKKVDLDADLRRSLGNPIGPRPIGPVVAKKDFVAHLILKLLRPASADANGGTRLRSRSSHGRSRETLNHFPDVG